MAPSLLKEMIAMIKKFILFFLRIIRRALCCFGRKRCDSNSHDDAHLEVVNVVSDSPNYKKTNAVSFLVSKLDDIKTLVYHRWSAIGTRGMINLELLRSI